MYFSQFLNYIFVVVDKVNTLVCQMYALFLQQKSEAYCLWFGLLAGWKFCVVLHLKIMEIKALFEGGSSN